MFEKLEKYIQKATLESGKLPESRVAILDQLAGQIRQKLPDQVNLIFICTHNSRRSHFGQVWAQVAAANFEIHNIATFSGGTEATALNPNAAAAFSRSGLQLEIPSTENPVHEISYSSEDSPIKAWSKAYSDATNPQKDFIAVMTCSDADEGCPVIFGANYRVSLLYEDPKISDGTALQDSTYDERCFQIASEMFYLMSSVKKSSS